MSRVRQLTLLYVTVRVDGVGGEGGCRVSRWLTSMSVGERRGSCKSPVSGRCCVCVEGCEIVDVEVAVEARDVVPFVAGWRG